MKRKKKIEQKKKSPTMQQKRICGRVTFCFLHPLVIPFRHLANKETPDPV